MVLLLKGMVGLGIIILPSTTKFVGYIGFFMTNIIVGLSLVFLLSLIIYVSVKIGYEGKRWEFGFIFGLILATEKSMSWFWAENTVGSPILA